MAQATSSPATPKQMGGHLRAVRRRKGLSLSEVARGAGLRRRELVNYERGKTTIPESDLWVLAGSIGVDVGELVPPAPGGNVIALRQETGTGTGTVTDAVAMLRRSTEHDEAFEHLGALRVLQQLPEGKRIPVKDRELAAIARDLGGDPGTIERKLQEMLGVDPLEAARLRAMLLDDAHGRRHKAKALGAAEVAPAARYSAPVVVPPTAAESAPAKRAAVDVFEELASLPEPLPLPDESTMPDLLAPPPAPENAVELVDGTFPTLGSGFGFELRQPVMAETTATTAGASAAANTAHRGADAPPIDVTPRPADEWGWIEPAPGAPLAQRDPADPSDWPAPEEPVTAWVPPPPAEAVSPIAFWEGTDDWAPVDGAKHDPTDAELAAADPNALWSFEPARVDPWSAGTSGAGAATVTGHESVAEVPVAAEMGDSPWITPTTDDAPAHESGTFGPWDHDPDPAAASSGFIVDWGEAPDATPDDAITGPGQWASTGTWDEPLTPTWEVRSDATEHADTVVETATDVDAYDAFAADPFGSTGEDHADDQADAPTAATGHTCDDTSWGEAHDTDDEADDGVDDNAGLTFGSKLAATLAATYLPEAADADAPADLTDPTASLPFVEDQYMADVIPIEARILDDEPDATTADEPWTGEAPIDEATEPVGEYEVEPVLAAPSTRVDQLPPIVWRADAFGTVDAVEPAIAVATDPEPEPEPDVEQEAVFVTAGSDWLLGNAVPLVEVQEAGVLVMRRADERWALADVTTTDDFVLEVEVDFRSGPGLGVLFRAGVDAEGRMSGYSFDIDPIYDGGGYLVRQWQDDRELWNPIARVKADDPNTMYGALTVRIEVHGHTLGASVNGAEVLVVDDLEQASRERDRGPATGNQVGVQAWSSSDLVIDTLRVAAH